jgi:hypothetical protein
MAEVLRELRSQNGEEPQALARQLEERLKVKDRRMWRRVSRHSS